MEITMNKSELDTELSEKVQVSKKSDETYLNALVDIITDELKKVKNSISWICDILNWKKSIKKINQQLDKK